MKKIKFFFIINLIFLLNVNFLYSSETVQKKINNCNIKVADNIDRLKINKINVELDNYRKWTKNSLKIIIGNFRYIPDKFKARFKASVTIEYENNVRCQFKASVRHSGDEKDHVNLKDNLIYQSIDVHLKEGNIRGITKFKLLRPKTRGKLEDEIFFTEILRQLNYLAPRTLYVKTKINNSLSGMIFQEKAAKELLEFNNRREGPILEGDERFFFSLAKDLPDNNVSNWSIGLVPILNKSVKAMLAKQINANIINKSENHKKMSYNSLTNLNLIYLYYGNKFQDNHNNYNYFDYDLDNNLLALFNAENTLKLDMYNLLVQATNSSHGLAPNNRKFYWNSLENYFEPINYDSNSNIESTPNVLRLPTTEIFPSAFNALKKNLQNLNLNNINENIKISGINLSKRQIDQKYKQIISNINTIESIFLKSKKDSIEYNIFSFNNANLLKNFNNSFKQINPDIRLVKYDKKNKSFQNCNVNLSSCVDLLLSKEQIADLFEGQLKINNKDYQYTGDELKLDNISRSRNFKETYFNDTKIFYDNDISLKINIDDNIIDIFQNKPGARIYFIDGELNNLTINFNGYGDNKEKNKENFPIDINGLTGCVSLINLSIHNAIINGKNSTCEDTINLINVKGNLSEIEITNSFMDALDIDFSDVLINKASITNANNDCLDLSYGKYQLKNIQLKECGDKGLSVGEKSYVDIENIEVQNANIGIASKDSSVTRLNTASLKNIKTCITAYKKKQEFNGGYIKVKNLKCLDYNTKIDIDNVSEIEIQNEL